MAEGTVRLRRRSATMAVLLALVSAVASAAQQEPVPADSLRDAPDEPVIVETRTGQRVSRSELLVRLTGVRYRLLGEIHDNPRHHELRAGLIRDLAASGLRPAVALEIFDLDRGDELRAAQSAHPHDADRVTEQGGLDRRSWRWPLHKPMIDAALDAGLPLAAANLSRATLQRAIRSDEMRAAAVPWGLRLGKAPWSSAQEATLEASIVEGHCGKLSSDIAARIARAQRERDAAMAQAMIDAATQDGAILLAGNGHVRKDIGVPVYLDRNDGSYVSVGFIEADGDAREVTPASEITANPGFDYLWFTTRTVRADPCALVPAGTVR